MVDKVGAFTYGAHQIRVLRWDGPLNPRCTVTIGNFCSIADEIEIITNGNHKYDRATTFPFAELGWITKDSLTRSAYGNGNIIIENDVWIARGVKIIGSVRIGNGAIIAAYSVIVKDVESYSIVGGNPAKHIKYRFDKETRDKLLKIQWWDWSKDKITEALPLLLKDDSCKALIEKYYDDTSSLFD